MWMRKEMKNGTSKAIFHVQCWQEKSVTGQVPMGKCKSKEQKVIQKGCFTDGRERVMLNKAGGKDNGWISQALYETWQRVQA